MWVYLVEEQTFSEVISVWLWYPVIGGEGHTPHSGMLSRVSWGGFLSLMFKWNRKTFNDKSIKLFMYSIIHRAQKKNLTSLKCHDYKTDDQNIKNEKCLIAKKWEKS